MTETSTLKKPAARSKTAAKPKPAAAKTSAKKPKVDPYDDPFAASTAPKPRTTKKRSTKKTVIQDNPLGMRNAAPDPYDDPFMGSAKKPAVRKSTTSASKKPAAKSAAAPSKKSATRKKPSTAKKSAPVDEFDMPLKPRAKKPKRGGAGGYFTFILFALTLICTLVVCLQLFEYSRFKTMRDAVTGDDFFAGTMIDGVDVSGMTLEGALTHWETQVEPRYSGRSVTLDTGATISASSLGYSSNYRKVIEDAWHAQTSGRLAERYAALTRYSVSGSGYSITRIPYTEAALEEYAAGLASSIDVAMSEPSITGFDTDTMGFTFGPGVQGRTLDRAKLIADMKTALDSGGGNVTLKIDTTEPTVSMEEMKSLYGLRAYAVTNASSSNSNRLTNIKLALSSINGLLLQPGEEFSFNKVVGKRTADKGYKVATAYNAGEVTEELGGGICQVSTTLFNAVVKAGLTPTERHAHSMPVSYVDKGKDAAVSWGNQDLKFVNSTDEPVYIVAYLDADKRVRIGVFGRAMENGRYITIEAELTEKEEFKTVYQYNAFLLPGTQEELQSGRNTYKAVAYKLTWSKDGDLIDREVLCYSTYRGRDQIIEYGP